MTLCDKCQWRIHHTQDATISPESGLPIHVRCPNPNRKPAPVKLETTRPIRAFETMDTERRQRLTVPIVVELHDRYMDVRLKGSTKRYPISYSGIYWLAIKKHAEEQRKAKAGRRDRATS